MGKDLDDLPTPPPVRAQGSNGNGNGNGSSNGNGNGNGKGNGTGKGAEVEYDDVEAPRGHVVRSKRSSMILSGELSAEPQQQADRAVTVEPSVAFGARPAAAAESIARVEADAALEEHTAQVMLVTRPRSSGGMLGVLIGAIIVAGVAVGAWYLGRATDKDDAAAEPAPKQAPAIAPVTTAPTTPATAPTAGTETAAATGSAAETGTATGTGSAAETGTATGTATGSGAAPSGDEPPVAPAPPEKAEIKIRFSSTPDGAEVRIPGAKKPLGVTPFEASFPRVEGAQVFEFRKKGYDMMTGQVALDVDSALTVALSKTGHHRPRGNGNSPSTTPTTDPSLDRGGTMDVLGNDH